MSQSTSVPVPPMAVRSAAAASDTPDLLYVLRHYRWLIIAGVILGTLAGAAIWFALRRYNPEWTANAVFQVMPPQVNPVARPAEGVQNADDTARFIRRQVLYITADRVLDKALQSKEFRTESWQSKWFAANSRNPSQALRKAVDVSPLPNTDVFRVSMTTRDPQESANLVNAIGRVYMEMLRQDQAEDEARRMSELNALTKKVGDTVKDLNERLNEFRNTHDIAAMTATHNIAMRTLDALTTEFLRSERDLTSAKAGLENVKKQVEAGTLTLSADMEAMIENDPTVRSLENQKLSLQSDKEVLLSRVSPQHESIRAIDTRIATATRQAEDQRSKLRAAARLRMQENAENVFKSIQAAEEDLRKRRDEKEKEVRDLDRWLVQHAQMVEELKVNQDILNNLKSNQTIEALKMLTDYSRVRLFTEARVPEEPSWPKWQMFIPGGFLIGLLLSYGLGYLLELTNTRVRTPRDITRTMQLPLLGFVPDQQDDVNHVGEISTSIRTAPTSMIAESFRLIRGQLAAAQNGHNFNTLLVASIAPGGGATTVAANLAIGMALNDSKVLLIDANFYRPGVKATFKEAPVIGLSDVIADPSKLDSAIAPVGDIDKLHVMSAGTRNSAGTGEMLESKSFREVLATLKGRYDMVIFDGAPLSLVGDSISLGAKVDGVIAIVRAGVISRGTIARVREQLRAVRANLMGIVLNAAQTHGAGYFKENYRTFYKYAQQKETAGSAS